jgi:hypothetical protein
MKQRRQGLAHSFGFAAVAEPVPARPADDGQELTVKERRHPVSSNNHSLVNANADLPPGENPKNPATRNHP